MKRLYVLLCFIVACSGYAKGQGAIPPAIDFKAYLAQVDSIMCDSIYRVDTLYYPWEEELQMIELRWKTVWKKRPCVYDSLYYDNSYSLMPSIFIFRNKEGAFTKVYNNYFNFNIDSQAFKAIDFVNTDSYKEKYIPIGIMKINTSYNKINVYKGLIDKVGNIKLDTIYEEFVFFKADSSIRVKEGGKYYFIDYNSLEKINDNIFQSIESINKKEKYSVVDGYKYYIDSINHYTGKAIIDNRGNNLLEENWIYIYQVHNLFFLANVKQESMIVDEKFNTIYHLTNTKGWTRPVFKYIAGKYVLSNLVLNESIYKNEEYYKNTASLIDIHNNTIIPFGKFNLLLPIYNNMSNKIDFMVRKFHKTRTVRVKSSDSKSSEIEIIPSFKYGIYDEHGILKMPIIYSRINTYYNYIYTEKKGKWSIYNLKYKKIIEDVNAIENQDYILNCRVLYTKNKSYIVYDLDKPLVKYKILEGNEKLYYHDLKADGTMVLHNKKTNTYIELK